MQTNSVSIEQPTPVVAANVRTACLVAFLIGVAMVFDWLSLLPRFFSFTTLV